VLLQDGDGQRLQVPGWDVGVDIGRTNIRLDMDAGAARQLAALLNRAADESEGR
jgi:hypothetical protein